MGRRSGFVLIEFIVSSFFNGDGVAVVLCRFWVLVKASNLSLSVLA